MWGGGGGGGGLKTFIRTNIYGLFGEVWYWLELFCEFGGAGMWGGGGAGGVGGAI